MSALITTLVSDPTPKQLATLSPRFFPYAVAIINGLRQAGIPAIVVADGARRTAAKQSILVSRGLSTTQKSKHLTGDAIDIDVQGYRREDIPESFWRVFGPWVESAGLRWGGRWTNPYDPGHVEYPG